MSWAEVNLDTATVEVEYKIVRVTGAGLLRVRRTKSDAGERTLRMPRYVVSMLRRRKLAAGGWGRCSRTRRAAGGTRRTPGGTCGARGARSSGGWCLTRSARRSPPSWTKPGCLRDGSLTNSGTRPSLTQDTYLGRRAPDQLAADALDAAAGT